MAGWAAVEAAATARRLAVIAEFTARRMGGTEHAQWMVDDWDAAAVEVGAALALGCGRAGAQMDLAMTLRTRLPKVAARLARGELSARTVAMIARRTDLVRDRDALAALDTALAERAHTWGPLSDRKLEAAIDVWICAVDPDAVRRTRQTVRDRDVSFGDPADHDGITTVFARLLATDAKLLHTRLTAMAAAVCDADPRTAAQRRADALGALAAGHHHLSCSCTAPSCPAAADDGRAASIVIHVLAEHATTTTDTDAALHGEDPHDPTIAPRSAELRRSAPPAAPTAAPPAPPPPPRRRAALIVGGPVLPAALLADLIARVAQVKPLPSPAAEPEKRHRPSAALDTWVRMRDLTCRAPGCNKPAVGADIDHTVAWPAGPTHPSNTKIYCRFHNLLKTFSHGVPGWRDWQQPDGTVEWTSTKSTKSGRLSGRML